MVAKSEMATPIVAKKAAKNPSLIPFLSTTIVTGPTGAARDIPSSKFCIKFDIEVCKF
jgi:hypothetical protein